MKKLLSYVLSLIMIITVLSSLPLVSNAAVYTTSFSPRTSIPTSSATWIKKYNVSNNCTRYAYGRISEILNRDATSVLGSRPDASKFPTLLSNAGYSYGTTPKKGSVMCTSGHVAIVESVNTSNKTLVVSEGNSYTDMSSNSKVIKYLIDGKSVIGYSTLTSGSRHGTWFDLRTISYSGVSAKYYYLVKEPTSITKTSVSGTSAKYTGSSINIANTLVVKYNNTILTYGTDYTLSKTSATSIGKYKVKISGKGNYSGAVSFTFKIYPKTPTLKTYTSKNKKIYLTWTNVKVCDKQKIYISSSSSFPSNSTYIVSVAQSKTSATFSYLKFNGSKVTLKKGQKYYVRMRAYKTVNGENIYGKYGKTRTVTIK